MTLTIPSAKNKKYDNAKKQLNGIVRLIDQGPNALLVNYPRSNTMTHRE